MIQPLMIRGRPALVRPDENGPAPNSGRLYRSRVLIIKGTARYAGSDLLGHYFRLSCLMYETDRIITTRLSDVDQWLEWRFACFRWQAETTLRIIRNELADLMIVRYGQDPCV